MKKKLLSILLVCILMISLTGCGKKSNNSSENVTKVGKLDLEVESIGEFHDGLASVKMDGKYGYIDKSGNITIEPQYRNVGNFEDGLAPACIGENYSNQKCGYIDKNGKTIIEFKYDDAEDFSFGYGVVKSGSNNIVVDKKGNEIITKSYSMSFGPISDNLFIVTADDVLKGYAIVDKDENVIIDGIAQTGKNIDGLIQVKQVADQGSFWDDGKWGYIDEQGKLVIDYQYDFAGDYVDGLAGVVKDGKYGFINKDNKYVIEPTFEYGKSTLLPNFSDGLVEIYEKPNWTIYNTKGEKVFEKNDDYSIQEYKDGYATFIKNDKYGFLDKKGKEVIENKYQVAYDFNDGLAKIYTSYNDEDDTGEFIFINKDGKTILGGKIVKSTNSKSNTNEEKNNSNTSTSSNETTKKTDNGSSNTNNNSNSNNNSNASNNSSSKSSMTSEGIKIDNKTMKYGTYNGAAAAEGITLKLNSDGTCTYDGKSCTYKLGTHDFAQDSSTRGSYKDCIIVDNGYKYYFYPLSETNFTDGGINDFIYSGN